MFDKILARTEPWGILSYNPITDTFFANNEIGSADLKTASPICIGWIIAASCNFRCVHCYGNNEDLSSVVLSTEQCLQIAERIIEARVLRVVISGGEPMLRSDLFVVIKKLYDANISVVLGTNGSFVNETHIDQLKLCFQVEISLDASNRITNDSIRPSRQESTSAFCDAMRAINLLQSNQIAVKVLTCVNSINQHDLLEISDLLASIGVKNWSISTTISAGRARTLYKALQPQSNTVEKYVSLIKEKHPHIDIRYSNRAESFDRYYCLILPDGQIATENLELGRKQTFGSMLRVPFIEFWNDSNFDLKQHYQKWVES